MNLNPIDSYIKLLALKKKNLITPLLFLKIIIKTSLDWKAYLNLCPQQTFYQITNYFQII
jgi:hypothetical protein